MSWLKQSTAITVKLGPFVDETDGKTAETGLTIGQADVRLSKNGGDLAQKSSATSCTHDEIGVYDCPLDTTDTGTLGRLDLFVHESGALPVFATFMVVPANVWDALFGADRLQVHADEITAGLLTSASFAAGAITAAVIATGAIDADAVAADAVTEIQSGLATAAALQTVDDLVDDLETRLTATRAGYLDNLSAGAVPTSGAIADAVWDEARSGHTTVGTFGEGVVVNSIAAGAITAAAVATGAIDADALAADAGTEIGTAVWATAARTLTAATNVTSTGAAVPITAGGLVSADVTAISTDATAANNAESFFDGTGYAGTGNTIPAVTTVNGLAGGVITAAAIATGAITNAKFAAGAIDAAADKNKSFAVDEHHAHAGPVRQIIVARHPPQPFPLPTRRCAPLEILSCADLSSDPWISVRF